MEETVNNEAYKIEVTVIDEAYNMEVTVNNDQEDQAGGIVESENLDVGLNVNVDYTDKDEQPESGNVPEIKKKTHFSCLICSRKFKQNAGRYNHMRRIHNIYPGEKANVKCLEKGCSFTCSYKEKLQLHLQEAHNFAIDIRVKKFDNLQEFLRWKDEFERQEKGRFVKKSGSRIREEGIRVGYYYCSRSGTYVSQSKGMKNPKKKGTSKTNHHCTASITSFELPDGKLEVKVCSTHYGHENELQHLRLTQTEKFEIVEQLCRGVPREMVLDNVRASSGSDVERIHLITMKDVKNIEKAYGIQANANEKATNMYDNLAVWITNIMSSENGPVLYFNGDNEVNSRTHTITLILLTKGQLEVLKKYCKSGVFYLSAFNSKQRPVTYCQNFHYEKLHNLHVVALMLLDDLNEAVPVSFMVTNELSLDKFEILFTSLQKKVPEISANALFTDDQKDIFSLWCSVFRQEPLHLWSNRFVDSDWRDNLASIPDEEVQVSIYEKLYSFLESTDIKDDVHLMLVNYVNELQSNPTTNKFATYFTSTYVGTEEMWAGCFGKSLIGVNAQLNMEITCNEIEEISNKKHWDRNYLVRIIQNLLKLVNDKQCIRQSKLQRQIHELPSHHTLALNVKPELILKESDNCWRVDSAKDPANIFSHVTRISWTTCGEFCVLSCPKCNACTHQYVCTCRVFMYDRTMCKHIHAVALSVMPKSEESDVTEEPPSSSNSLEKEHINEDLTLLSKLRKSKRGRKKKTSANDKTVLQIIEDVLQNKDIEHPKQKRKRPKKGVEISNEKDEDSQGKELKNVPVRKLRERKIKVVLNQDNAIKDEDLSDDSNSLKPHKANILRRSKKRV